MKISTKQLSKVTSAYLKNKLKQVPDHEFKNDKIRLHRAISWIKCAEDHTNNPDIKFISLWIAFNACYADNQLQLNIFTEKENLKHFINQLVHQDHEELFFNILWEKFSGPIRLLIQNQYAYKYFWVTQRENNIDWRKSLNISIKQANKYLSNYKVANLLEVVLDRLYTVRNQLLNGGSTYKSKLNRYQVTDASNILEFLMPVIVDIMITNIPFNWGQIRYPVVE